MLCFTYWKTTRVVIWASFLQRGRIVCIAQCCISHGNSVCLSVCLLHAGTLPRRINVESCGLQSLWGTKNSLDFWHQQLLGGDVPFHLKFALKVTHPPMKSANIDQYLLITSQLQWLKLVTSKLACSRRFPRPIIKSHPEEKVGVALG